MATIALVLIGMALAATFSDFALWHGSKDGNFNVCLPVQRM
jgi:hypothetical protein